jgi:molybdenum cofactor guanylyltransferase
MFDTPCVIFAGGKSSRMGEDKALLPFSSYKTLTQFQLSRLSQIFTAVYISCKDKNKFDFQATFIEDIETDGVYAPTAGFVSVFKTIKEDRFFALSVDSPFVGVDEIAKIINVDENGLDAVVAKTTTGIQPMCGMYHRSMSEKFEDAILNDNHKLGYLLKNSKTKYVYFENEKAFFNINHPHEYKEALTLI